MTHTKGCTAVAAALRRRKQGNEANLGYKVALPLKETKSAPGRGLHKRRTAGSGGGSRKRHLCSLRLPGHQRRICGFELECFINLQLNVLLATVVNVDRTSPPRLLCLNHKSRYFPSTAQSHRISQKPLMPRCFKLQPWGLGDGCTGTAAEAGSPNFTSPAPT